MKRADLFANLKRSLSLGMKEEMYDNTPPNLLKGDNIKTV
jgi:hypothetical protein